MANEAIRVGREVLVDTETTGLDPKTDRIVEIALVETVDFMKTGRELHLYFNPERDVPPVSTRIHGLTAEFLSDKPVFADRMGDIMAFLDGAPFVAHNASFDVGMINAELRRCGKRALACVVKDTLAMARGRFPTGKCDLSSLCRKFGIDLSSRVKHGALTDTLLLAEVYLNLNGGRHRTFDLSAPDIVQFVFSPATFRPDRKIGMASVVELQRHLDFVASQLVNRKKPEIQPSWTRFVA